MAKYIRVDDQVYEAMRHYADSRRLGIISPNNVLRLVLGMKPAGKKQGAAGQRKKGKRRG